MTDSPHHAVIDSRPEQPGGFVADAIADAVGEALATGQFQQFLAARGWVLVHIGDGTCPEPPAEWLHDGIVMTEPGWIDPVGRLEELWEAAWTAGHRVGQATGAAQPT